MPLKMKEDVANNFIFRAGELHVVFVTLKVIWTYIESSGLNQIFVEASMKPVKKFLERQHMKHRVEAHNALYLALCHFDKDYM